MVQFSHALGLPGTSLGGRQDCPTVRHTKAPPPAIKATNRAISEPRWPQPRPSQPQRKEAPVAVAQTCTLFDQPPELILLISAFLDDVSQAAFALSCRTALALAGPAPETRTGTRFPLRVMQRAALLQLLESEPTVGDHLYYCDRCVVLHSFDEARWTRPATPLLGREPCSTWTLHPMGSPLRLEYAHARLVMNRHLHGSPIGLPLGSLAMTITSVRSGARLTQSRTARVLDGELYMRSHHRVLPRTPTLDPDAFARQLYVFSLNICHHQETDHVHTVCPAVRRFAGANPTRPSSSRGACKRCRTDYEARVQVDEDEEFGGARTIVATVVCYQRLGRCRETPDPGAYGLFNVGRSRAMENLYWRDLEACPAGSVQARWEASGRS